MRGKQRQDQDLVDYIASLYDEVQAKMDASKELAARLQMEKRERCKYRHNQLNKKTFEEIQALYIKEQERDADFMPIGSERDEKRVMKRRYPLIRETLERMMELRLTVESEGEAVFELLRFIQK
ncbi:hypothetical protein Tco_1449343 [Tanacetum coccineum]